MNTYHMHYLNHAGFIEFKDIDAETPGEAAYKQMISRHDFLTNPGATPHSWKAELLDNGWITIRVYAEAVHPHFHGTLRPGDYWFNSKHRVGSPDDCLSCGGTGGSHYTSFGTECWKCGDGESRGRSSGKRSPDIKLTNCTSCDVFLVPGKAHKGGRCLRCYVEAKRAA